MSNQNFEDIVNEIIALESSSDQIPHWVFVANWKVRLLLVRIADDLYYVKKCKCKISECQDITKRLVNWNELENYLKRGFLD